MGYSQDTKDGRSAGGRPWAPVIAARESTGDPAPEAGCVTEAQFRGSGTGCELAESLGKMAPLHRVDTDDADLYLGPLSRKARLYRLSDESWRSRVWK